MGQVYNAVNDYEQPINYNTVASGDTGIRIRTRQVQNEQQNMNFAMHGTAPRRIRLVKHALGSNEMAKGESCSLEEHNLKPVIAGDKKVSEYHAADVNEPRKTSESTGNRKISQQVSHAGSILGLKDFSLLRRVPFISKASSKLTIWSSVIVVSAFVLILVVLFANIWGYLSF